MEAKNLPHRMRLLIKFYLIFSLYKEGLKI